jgi:hypothetical protein
MKRPSQHAPPPSASFRARSYGTLTALALLALPRFAEAQSDRELATRQELIVQASDLADQGKHADALLLAKRAAAIKTTPSLRLFLAHEESALGLLADAYGNGRQCAVEAEADLRLNDRDRILSACKAIEETLRVRVARVTVKLAGRAPPDVHVTISGEDLNPALVGAPYIVSPGKLTVAVTAPGYAPYRADVEVSEGGSTEVDVQLAREQRPEPSCGAGMERVQGTCVQKCAPGFVTHGGECVPAEGAASPPARVSAQGVAGIALGGGGVVLLAVGAYFGATALARNADSAPYCGVGGVKDACYGSGPGLRSEAVHDATIATTLLAVGAASAVAGVVLWVTAPSSKARASVGFDGRLLQIGGAF